MTYYTLENSLVNKFDDSKCNKKTKLAATKTIINHYNCPSSVEYAKFLGSIIVKCYKKENKQDQSLWNTDTTRYSYIIKYIKNNISKWEQDKKGTKTQTKVIDPLITCVTNLLIEYDNYMCEGQKDHVKEYIKYTQDKRLKQGGKKGDPTCYTFESFGTDCIDQLILCNASDMILTDIINSCHTYNSEATKYKKIQVDIMNHSIKIKKVIEHIKGKEFGAMIVRDIASHFYLEKNIKNNDEVIINSMADTDTM
jgi:hypothetical protein